jgi:hypothetical protein
MNVQNLQSLFTGLEAATPDGRWNLFQKWLSDNPEWKEETDRWLTLPSDDVVNDLIETIAKKYEMDPAMVRLLTPASVKARAKSAIETLQTCYRERAGETEKEIKNGNRLKSKSRSGSRKRTHKTHKLR